MLVIRWRVMGWLMTRRIGLRRVRARMGHRIIPTTGGITLIGFGGTLKGISDFISRDRGTEPGSTIFTFPNPSNPLYLSTSDPYIRQGTLTNLLLHL
jgi:hypothetical protein